MSVRSQLIVIILNNNCNVCKLKKLKLITQCNQEQKTHTEP